MRKTRWISLAIALSIAAVLAGMEQKRSRYFLEPQPHPQPLSQRERGGATDSLDKKLAFLMHRAELATYDARFKLRGDQKPNPDIAIIAIDENSLAQLHQWPWPRSIH